MKEKVLVSWSGGKDSAMALWEVQKAGTYEILTLLTTVTEAYDRVSMHGVRRTLLAAQARALGLPLQEVFLSPEASNAEYEARMEEVLLAYQELGVRTVLFGDIFLEEIRQYRERNLARIGMRGLFPLWKRDTRELVRAFLAAGFRAIIVCVDLKVLDASFAGRMVDEQFLNDLPASVDPCGENGEFHSFVFDGPIFQRPVPFTKGEIVTRGEFCFCDLLPSPSSM
ncbi:MAG: diphthine--ammonia ligase [Blastocatellia bacterium]|nr:diphthine--ammonia ligase [Blastocatellia bacterium]MCS7158333.1 diphthine--ammonia ligase [Blastocatellia bacterium]MCX7752839.1 diphthine--ammonia ligase [Blastocatellia bacterium]MDW8167895.1 diphthine--ammonia ligase [Acidobacteriota bacterium]MDW8257254.1 diphthine--ammonia ligase [Acidobacteriota bacterium]